MIISKLKFNGVYQSSMQFDRLDLVEYWHYFLFYKDGSVKLITHTGPSKEAIERGRKDIRITKGVYKITGEKIRIVLEDGFIFEGALKDNMLYLEIDDGIGYFQSSDMYKFISNEEI